ncbi:MAG: GIY-YIG nuclease family protein [Candidatus Thiodiazotropha sp.]
MRLARGETLTIGRLGRERFLRGWYLYVGSAFGPGGVAARCRHHRQVSTRPRWHVDYLRAVAPLRAIWFSHAEAPLEHLWAARLGGELGLQQPMPGFGASDCECASHLFFVPTRPDMRHFSMQLASDLCGDSSVYCEIV